MSDDIKKMQEYFAGLTIPQKKEFVLNLQKKLESLNSVNYKNFFNECIQTYNAEVREHNKKAGFPPKPKAQPEISPESFAKALATMLSGEGAKPTAASIKPKIVGKWQRGENFFYEFKDDDTFETNEFIGATPDTISMLKGNYKIAWDNNVLMEPHDKLTFNSLMLSPSGENLIIGLKNGTTVEYKRESGIQK
ncbi:MAG: hypothetical protein FWF79_03755 [Defluviitaleaceae bacterium]|nr:hypothetical protein [Defluviitaleaceae bacterium]